MLWHYLLDEQQMFKLNDLVFVTSFVIVLIALFYAALSLFSFKSIHKPVLLVVLFLAASSSYFMYQYDIVIDKNMIVSLATMSSSEVFQFLDCSLLFHMLALWVLPACLILQTNIWYKSRNYRFQAACYGALTGIILALVILVPQYQDFSCFVKKHQEIRFRIVPTNVLYFSSLYFFDSLPTAFGAVP